MIKRVCSSGTSFSVWYFIKRINYRNPTSSATRRILGRTAKVSGVPGLAPKWDIRFNPVKSQLMTFGGSNPDKTTVHVYVDKKVVQWCTKVKYLGLYLIGGADFKRDLTAAKRKYYGCFTTIMSVCCWKSS